MHAARDAIEGGGARARRALASTGAVLRSRLGRGLALPLFLTILAIEALLFVPAYQQYRGDLLRQVEAQALGYVQAAGRLPDSGPSWLLQHLADATRSSRWTGAAVINERGQLLAQHGDAMTLPAACPADATRRRTRWEAGVMTVCWPASQTRLAYAVAARLDVTDVGRDLSAYRLRLAVLALLVATGATALLLLLIGRRVLSPLLDLRRTMIRVAADPHGTPRPDLPGAPRGDEIAELTSACGRMLDEIAGAFDAVRRQNDALRQSEARFRQIFEKSHDAIVIADPERDTVVAMNPAAERLLGLTLADAAEPPGLTALYDHDAAGVRAFHADVAASESERTSRLVCRAKDDTAIPVDVAGSRIEWNGSVYVLHVMHDMREHHRLQAELQNAKERAEEADRMKTRFLASMSHELRTPLNAIIGFSEIIGTQAFGPVGTPKYRDYANDILASARHLHEMINDILDISKIEAGRMEVHAQHVDLSEAVGNAERLIAPRAAAKTIAVDANLPGDQPAPFVDDRHLRQILINLLANAVKFTPEGGRVVIGTDRRPAGGVRITVTDTGPGMDQTDVARALEPFRQVHGDSQHGGTGLGLPLCKRLAEINGGGLTLDTAPGRGTTVIVDLPASAASEPISAVG